MESSEEEPIFWEFVAVVSVVEVDEAVDDEEEDDEEEDDDEAAASLLLEVKVLISTPF